ncbi:MAG: hypothetical protein ABL989_17455, partial [Gammaproteobacteria bacterium]
SSMSGTGRITATAGGGAGVVEGTGVRAGGCGWPMSGGTQPAASMATSKAAGQAGSCRPVAPILS